MYVKTYKTDKHFMVAACDKELVGQTLKNETCEIKVNASFYQGEETTEDILEDLLSRATTANLIGQKAVSCAVSCGLVDQKSVIYFDKIPHALYFTL
ncbi:MAG: DUF424 family protein [Methanosarcinales archaeon]|jgi:hypothetical protein|nr:DUF424 family protein [Methanosarcinales archaeon]